MGIPGVEHQVGLNPADQHVDKKNSRKRMKKQSIKKKLGERTALVEDVDLLSKEQLKKLVKNPLNSIRASGKRKRKMLKRLRQNDKDKSQMEVEAVASTSKAEVADTDPDVADMQVEGADEAT